MFLDECIIFIIKKRCPLCKKTIDFLVNYDDEMW